MGQAGADTLERALQLLGAQLEADRAPTTLLVVGGGTALRVRGLITRTTRDVDVVARVERALNGTDLSLQSAVPLPDHLVRGVGAVAADLGLPPSWLNTESAALFNCGLPDGCLGRCVLRWYGS